MEKLWWTLPYRLVYLRNGQLIITEKLWMNLAWFLPRSLVYWCAIRLMSEATCTKYSDKTPDEISIIMALDCWEK